MNAPIRRITTRTLRTLDDQHVAVHAAMRTRIHVAGMVAFCGFFGLVLPMHSGVSALLGVTSRDTAPWAAVYLASYLAATIAFRTGNGRTPLYLWLNRLETLMSALGIAWLVTRSSRPDTLLWALLFSFAYQAGTVGSDRVYTAVTLVLGGSTAVVVQITRGAIGPALIGAALTVIALVIYLTLSRAAGELARVISEREALQRRISELLVHEERSRIARDLHDGLGSELSALIWSARMLQADDPKGRDQFAARIQRGLEELRQIVWALRTPECTLAEVVVHLRTQLAEQCADRVGLSLQVSGGSPAEVTLDGEQRLHIVRSAQEAVRNVVRHAAASTIDVHMKVQTDSLEISITDDGRGISKDALALSEGGLANLRTRAERLGGECVIDSRPGHTRILVRAPL